MKILFVSHTANFSKFNLPYMHYLRDLGWTVHYASAGEETVKDCDKHFTVSLRRSPLSPKNITAYKELKKIINKNSYDIVHSHTPTGGVIARLATMKRQSHKPQVIYTSHGFHFYKGSNLLSWLILYPIEKFLSRFTDDLVTINKEDYNLAKNKMHAKRTHHLSGVGVDLGKFSPATTQQKNDLRKKNHYSTKDILLICVGELNKNKNQSVIIKALARIKNPNLRLLLIGIGNQRSALKELAHDLGVENKVDFLGYRQDMNELYQMSDVAISASIREGLGLGIVEAMACGLPLICSKNRGHSEIIIDSQNGKFFDALDEKDLATKIKSTIKERSSLTKAHNAKSAQRFSIEKSLAAMAKVYDS